ncbi:MAG: GNAT family N-acetyltransferase [Bacteroidota bacterium]|nr:GNAT family N-acetyltransferase [Bacteroidota bacterium]
MIRLPIPSRIETDRLLLQRLRYEDAEEIFYAYASKPEATKFLSWITHRSVDDTRAFLGYAVESWNLGTDYSYSIRLKNGMLIGSIGLVHDDGKVQVGYVLSPAHWNKGYMTEACRNVLSVLRRIHGIYRIGTFVDADNIASVKVLEKCGMTEEARLRKWFRFVNQNNQPKDCLLYRMLP